MLELRLNPMSHVRDEAESHVNLNLAFLCLTLKPLSKPMSHDGVAAESHVRDKAESHVYLNQAFLCLSLRLSSKPMSCSIPR